MLSGSLANALRSARCATASPSGPARAGSKLVSQTSRISGSGVSSHLQSTRSYASTSSGDLFSNTLAGGEALKDAAEALAPVLKPRFPIQRRQKPTSGMRKRYKNRDFMESVAHKRRVPTSLKKVWHEAYAIRRLPVAKAMSFLEVYPTRSSKHLLSAVRQAKTNAVWRGFKAEDLEVSKVVIGKGNYLKRMMPHAKGRAGRVTHPFQHLSVYVRPTKQALKEEADKNAANKSESEVKETKPVDPRNLPWNKRGTKLGKSAKSSKSRKAPKAPKSDKPVDKSGKSDKPVKSEKSEQPATPEPVTPPTKSRGWWPFGSKESSL